MYKVMFATLLAAGLFAAPLTYSSAARAQQPSASEKTAKTNKEPSAGQLALVKRLTGTRLVTAVVGQGPHAVQPIERINDEQQSHGRTVAEPGARGGAARRSSSVS